MTTSDPPPEILPTVPPLKALEVGIHRARSGTKVFVQAHFEDYPAVYAVANAPGAVVICRGGSA